MNRKNLLLLIGVIALCIVPLAMIKAPKSGEGIFNGSDDQATDAIARIHPEYHRWFRPLWEPPSSEVESLLFGVQAAIGAGLVCYCLGYYRGIKKAQSSDAKGD